ncbi:sphingolipid transporter [Sporobolomyces koalae]|uniref:sphingolipid transporter n=1 Tax=Sporobolomyces koalae TaxID=500713 RepID=UPI00317366AF
MLYSKSRRRELISIALLAVSACADTGAVSSIWTRSPGRCAINDSCGKKSIFGGDIPCPYNGKAQSHDDDLVYLATLKQVCGDDFSTDTCCTLGQLETLATSLAQADPLISSCPACRINFRRFYCQFTCSPDQSQFLTVTETQTLKKDGHDREAVKTVEFAVSAPYGQGFFDSCRGVKFGATNGYAMDLIGGGATDYLSFLRYMGQERALGSPFQIDFPSDTNSTTLALSPAVPLSISPHPCSSSDPNIRCACPDCPDVCAALPPVLSPRERDARRCRVGKMDCFPFVLVILYAVVLVASIGILVEKEIRMRYGYSQIKLPDIPLEEDDAVRNGQRHSPTGTGMLTRLRHRLSMLNTVWSHPEAPRDTVNRSDPSSTPVDASSEDPLAGNQQYDETPVALSNSAAMKVATSRTRASTAGNSVDFDAEAARSPTSRGSSQSRKTGSNRNGNPDSIVNSPSTHRLSLSFGPEYASSVPDIPPQPRTYKLNTLLSRSAYSLGYFCAKRPVTTILLGLTICGLCNIGWKDFQVEKDPVRLWVPKGSPVANEKSIFEENFGPFYRTEQLFFSVAPNPSRSATDGQVAIVAPTRWDPVDAPVLTSFETLSYILSVENRIRTLTTTKRNISLPQVCFAPSARSQGTTSLEDCIVQSPLAYFQHSLEDAGVTSKNWRKLLDSCAESPASCLPTFGQPIEPKFVFGRIPQDGTASEARAVVVTYVVRNSLDPAEISTAEEWETELEEYLKEISKPGGEASERGLRIDWSTGLSLEQELGAAANTDVAIVVLSYILMFVYIAFGLGGTGLKILGLLGRIVKDGLRLAVVRVSGGAIKLGRDGGDPTQEAEDEGHAEPGAEARRRLLVESKFGLGTFSLLQVFLSEHALTLIHLGPGLFGILLVLLSISTAVALLSAIGIRTTLIIAEVLPFLILAIGVDNVFLLTYELEAQLAKPIRSAQSEEELYDDDETGSNEERIAKVMAKMGPSILLSASCETVAFALGALTGMPAVRNFALYASAATLINALLQVTVFVSALALDQRRVEAGRLDLFPLLTLSSPSTSSLRFDAREPFLQRFFRTKYAPNLLRNPVKYIVVALFGGLFVLSWIGARHVDLGLDQRLALPSSSYLVNYFNAVDTYLEIGPPVYFVIRHDPRLDITQTPAVEKVCGRFSACHEFSMANVLEAERKRTNSSFLAEPPAVWVDDFVQWMNPLLEDCCRVKKRNTTEFCSEHDSPGLCKPCFEDREPEWSTTLEGLPQNEEFMRFLNQWLISPTDESCPLGGRSSYSAALSLPKDRSSVSYSHIRTYHSPLKGQRDFIEAYEAAKRIAADLSSRTVTDVFAYSLFYVFFSSYSSLWSTTFFVLSLTLLAILGVSAIVLGSIRTSAVVVLTIFLSVTSLIGIMGVWNVSLNPLSLVNLVIGAGIAVEFCSHIARSFMGVNGGLSSRDERAMTALVKVGPSVLSGIFCTKIIGIVTLSFTRSKLLEVYYFRMWFALILSGALHGLVFLPVALALWGGQGYSLSKEEGDASWISRSLERRYESENSRFRDDDSDDEV